MNRRDLEEAIFRACKIVGQKRVIVIGSQAILASYDFEQLPRQATLSKEADIAPEHDFDDHLSQRLWMPAGQDSEWANERDFYIDAVSANTAYLPERWRERAIEVSVPGHPDYIGVCVLMHTICALRRWRKTKRRIENSSAH